MSVGDGLTGQRVLVVEDEWIVASDTTRVLQEAGAEVVGPTATVDMALALIRGPYPVDAALLDLHLKDGKAYQLADMLDAQGIRYAFISGYQPDSVAANYRHVPFCEKPATVKAVVACLSRAPDRRGLLQG